MVIREELAPRSLIYVLGGEFNIYVTNDSLPSKVSDKINETCFVILERLPRMVNLLNNPAVRKNKNLYTTAVQKLSNDKYCYKLYSKFHLALKHYHNLFALKLNLLVYKLLCQLQTYPRNYFHQV